MAYMHRAMEGALYRILPEENTIYGEIPGFEGVTAEADTLEHCRHDLIETLEEWIFFRVSRQLPLPQIDDLTPPLHQTPLTEKGNNGL